MYVLALAADYDGTIAHHGFVTAETYAALSRLRHSGRRLLLVTGRELADLKHTFSQLAIFDRVIAENGAVIYDPSTGQERSIAPAPPAALIQKLMERQVEPISVGRSIVATWEPHQTAVLAAIQELGLESQIVFNKGAVMVLPPGVNKATGLQAALSELDISACNVAAVGDAENDHAFLRLCGCAAAVANALPTIKDEADIVLSRDHGAGVIELVERIIRDDARIIPPSRQGLLVGTAANGEDVYIEPERSVLIAGNSGSGKSTFAISLAERMVERRFEFCVFDPEGDYPDLQHAVCIGNASQVPQADEAITLLREAGLNLVINTVGMPVAERQRLFAALAPPITELRTRSGRPQWVLIDEAHQLFGAPTPAQAADTFLNNLRGAILITVDPACLADDVLNAIDVVLAFGSAGPEVVAAVAGARNMSVPVHSELHEHGHILYWLPTSGRPPASIATGPPRQSHKRHTGKYAVGDVGTPQSFYFRGRDKAINVPARNLTQFLELSEQVPDAIWDYHLRARDYSAWFRHVIKDEELASEAVAVETNLSLGPRESRRRIAAAVARRYMVSTPRAAMAPRRNP